MSRSVFADADDCRWRDQCPSHVPGHVLRR